MLNISLNTLFDRLESSWLSGWSRSSAGRGTSAPWRTGCLECTGTATKARPEPEVDALTPAVGLLKLSILLACLSEAESRTREAKKAEVVNNQL
jgi:hypothetical protein